MSLLFCFHKLNYFQDTFLTNETYWTSPNRTCVPSSSFMLPLSNPVVPCFTYKHQNCSPCWRYGSGVLWSCEIFLVLCTLCKNAQYFAVCVATAHYPWRIVSGDKKSFWGVVTTSSECSIMSGWLKLFLSMCINSCLYTVKFICPIWTTEFSGILQKFSPLTWRRITWKCVRSRLGVYTMTVITLFGELRVNACSVLNFSLLEPCYTSIGIKLDEFLQLQRGKMKFGSKVSLTHNNIEIFLKSDCYQCKKNILYGMSD